ncbi:PTS sugar transporter subunit IIB [Microbacterium sp. MPKO10]|uniref:PTS sugar transporter subunit IIB n=1 Tax=Microbacterium sp. MPKO10 TaxID=2989818 RepID=UPI0022355CDE|nr:PTS IIB subunit [Microbacterium sp. MPKO10]MCW4457569.1 PTS IIB subunit [Microbacterium sp. MPKO10]
MRIIVVCGAGASSTFVALRVRRAAASRGQEISARAVPIEAVDAALAEADVLLLGAHLATGADELECRADEAGVAFAVMPEEVFIAPTGDAALDLALAAVGEQT